MTIRPTAAILCLLAVLCFRGAEASPLLPPALPHSGLGETVRYHGPESPEQKPLFGPPVVYAGVERQIVVLNPEIVVGEPLHVRLLLRATEPETRPQFMARLAWGTDIRAFLIPPDSNRPYEFLGQRLGSNVPMGAVEFEDFTNMRLDFRMAMDRDAVTGAAFEIPGTYQMRVLHTGHGRGGSRQEFRLGDFEITVRQPEGDDARALEILDDYRVFELFQIRSTFHGSGRQIATEAHLEMLERLVEEVPSAALRPHAMVILAEHNRRIRDLERAYELYDRVAEEYAGSPLAEEATMARLRTTMAHEDLSESRRVFAQAWSDPRLTQLAYPNSPHWNMFVKNLLPEERGTQWMVFEKPGPDPEMEHENGPRMVFSEEVQQMWGLPAEMEGSRFELPLAPGAGQPGPR